MSKAVPYCCNLVPVAGQITTLPFSASCVRFYLGIACDLMGGEILRNTKAKDGADHGYGKTKRWRSGLVFIRSTACWFLCAQHESPTAGNPLGAGQVIVFLKAKVRLAVRSAGPQHVGECYFCTEKHRPQAKHLFRLPSCRRNPMRGWLCVCSSGGLGCSWQRFCCS